MGNTFYSQHGEDIIALRAFARSRGPRFFVEVGMIDGRRFSNTLALEQHGWHGVCVEAHPGFVDHVRRNRPNSKVIHCAAADREGTLPFHADPRGDLSGLTRRDNDEMRDRFGDDFQGFETVDVPVRTLDDLLTEANAPRNMEVVSIDIEGGELAALHGFDLDHWRPRLLILEADDDEALRDLCNHLHPYGYHLARRVGVNAMFTRSRPDAWRVRMARVNQRVLHTANPIDQNGEDRVMIPSAYETRGEYVRRCFNSLSFETVNSRAATGPHPHRGKTSDRDRVATRRLDGARSTTSKNLCPPVTAIVIFRDEAPLLERCLSALTWCDEIIGVDMNSTDGSAEVAAWFVDRLYRVDPYPIAEPTRVATARLASHDWILLVDPDEVIPETLSKQIQGTLRRAHLNKHDVCDMPAKMDTPNGAIPGAIALPMKFYFKGDRVDGTVWGTLTYKQRLIHRERCKLLPLCNRMSELRPGFGELRIDGNNDNAIQHYWSDSYRELAKRHFTRYAHLEAAAMVARGQRFGWYLTVRFPLTELRRTLRDFDGWRMGPRGWALSLIYFLYVVVSGWLTLYYQCKPSKTNGNAQANGTSLPTLVPHRITPRHEQRMAA